MFNLSDNSVQYILVVVVLVLLGYLVVSYLNKQPQHEQFEDVVQPPTTAQHEQQPNPATSVEPAEPQQMAEPKMLGQMEATQHSQLPAECYPRDVLTSADLLPNDANSKWAQANPSGQGSLMDKNFLNAGFHIGINTVGSTKRNGNLQLRSEPPNPRVPVSPWMNSTIEPDINRRPLEIGGDY